MAKSGAAMRQRREGGSAGRRFSGSKASLTALSPLALDRLIHERARLAIVSALAAADSLTFNDLKRILDTTDGNLSVHARKLEEAEYISCTKSFVGRVPKTVYRLTGRGRQAFQRYLEHMESLLRAAREH